MHRAVESIGVYDSAESISRTPLDFAIALQTCTDDHPLRATDTVKTFVNFLETGELHTCCARRRVRSGLRPPAGLTFQLARLYDVLQRRSQTQHDETLADKAKQNRANEGKRQLSGLIVDTVHDHYSHVIVGNMPTPPVLRLNVDAYREWIAWCVAQPRKLYSRRSLEAWASESLTFVDRLEEELASLA
jgi:hypothetical protein